MSNQNAEIRPSKCATNDAQSGDSAQWLCCPTCHVLLRENSSELQCTECNTHWPIRDGIADFTDSARSTEQETFREYAAALPKLIRLARSDGWFEALSSVVRTLPRVGPDLFNYATDESKGDLVYVMNIESGHKVLDLGCRLGGISVALARHGADCHMIDISHEQTAFSAERCRQMGFPNVKAVCAGDDMKLPVGDDYFDGIVMDGVIERVGCLDGLIESPEEAQLAMLREVHRILKRGGVLYVSSKNLYALLYILGVAPDHVTKIPWVGMLPYGLQRVLTLGRAKDSRARIYGLNGFRRLFKTAGFREHAVHALLPSFRYPRRIVPLYNAGIIGLKQHMTPEVYNSRLERIIAGLLPIFLLKRLVYCYGFVLIK